MLIKETEIKGLVEIFPQVFEDDRGVFFEACNDKKLHEAGIPADFVQDNQSFSKKGVIRGLHFQKAPYAQGKLVRVITGSVVDIAVDLRKGSPTFGHWEKVILDAERKNMLYIPEGFAHGFAALEETIFIYKCTNYFNKESEAGIIWNDETLGIDWEVENPIVSQKDKELPDYKELLNTL